MSARSLVARVRRLEAVAHAPTASQLRDAVERAARGESLDGLPPELVERARAMHVLLVLADESMVGTSDAVAWAAAIAKRESRRENDEIQ
jgi:hypothetical protein